MIDRLPQIDSADLSEIDPRASFGSPEEIKRAEGLSQTMKEKLLHRWEELAHKDRGSDPRVAGEAERGHDDLNTEIGEA